MADSRSKDGQRVRDIIRWNVETNTSMEDDGETVSYSSRWLGRRPVDGLYVHPKTGILCFTDRESFRGTWAQPRAWERDIDYIALADGIVLSKMDGVWYKIWETTREEGVRDSVWNPETGKHEPSGEVRTYTVRSTHKEQLDHKSIEYLKKNLLRHGTNKDFLARLNGKYIPAYKWK
jgi:hypothetical protein